MTMIALRHIHQTLQAALRALRTGVQALQHLLTAPQRSQSHQLVPITVPVAAPARHQRLQHRSRTDGWPLR